MSKGARLGLGRASSGRLAVSLAVAALAAPACRGGGGGGDGGSDGLVRRAEDIVGTWVRESSEDSSSVTLVFHDDGTYETTSVGSWGTDEGAGRFTVSAGLLELVSDEDVEDGGCAFAVTSTFFQRVALFDDILFTGSINVRTSGSGAGVDGTWVAEVHSTEVRDGECDGTASMISTESLLRATTTIDGDAFEQRGEYSQVITTDGEDETDESEQTMSGAVRVDRDAVFTTTLERDGAPVSAAEQDEGFWGLLVGAGVAVRGGADDRTAEDIGFHRQ